MADRQASRPSGRQPRSGHRTEPSTEGARRDADTGKRPGDRPVPHAPEDANDPAEHPGEVDRRSPTGRGDDRRGPADSAADGARGVAAIGRRAAALVSTLTRRQPESVVFVERSHGGCRVGVEVVEVARIPDSADILTVYEVRLDVDGDLISYQRTRHYGRGDLQREHRS
jgi:Gas vesicle synthesis protein GvpO